MAVAPQTRQAAHSRKFAAVQGLEGMPCRQRAAGLDLDKYGGLPVAGNDVDFTAGASPVALNDGEAVASQVVNSEAFPALPRMSLRAMVPS